MALKIKESDLSMLTDRAHKHFIDDRKMVTMSDGDFKNQCFLKAAVEMFTKKGIVGLEGICYPQERSSESQFED